jgi:hypothetical protein
MVAFNARFAHVPSDVMSVIRTDLATAKCPRCGADPVLLTVTRGQNTPRGYAYCAIAACPRCEMNYGISIQPSGSSGP